MLATPEQGTGHAANGAASPAKTPLETLAEARAILQLCFPKTPARRSTHGTEGSKASPGGKAAAAAASNQSLLGRYGPTSSSPGGAKLHANGGVDAANGQDALLLPPSPTAAAAAGAVAEGAALPPKGQQVYLLRDPGVLDLGGNAQLHIPLLYDDLAKTGAVPRLEDVQLPDDLLRNALNSSHPAAFAALVAEADARRAARQDFLAVPKKFLLASDTPDGGMMLREAPHLEVKPPVKVKRVRMVNQGGGTASQAAAARDAALDGSEPATSSRKRAGTPSFEHGPAKRQQLVTPNRASPGDAVGDELGHSLEAANHGAEALGAEGAPRSLASAAADVAKAQKILAAAEAKVEEGGELDLDKLPARQRAVLSRAAGHDPELRARLEDAELRREWISLAKRDVPRAARQLAAKRAAAVAAGARHSEGALRELRLRAARALKEAGRGSVPAMRRLVRDMMGWWRKANKEAVEAARAQEKAAIEARRREEAAREERRQKQRLNFLLTQTELYGHFMQNKMGGVPGSEAAGTPEPSGQPGQPSQTGGLTRVRLQLADDEEEQATLAAAAAAKAQAAVAVTLGAAAAFDREYLKGAAEAGGAPGAAATAKPAAAAAAAPGAVPGSNVAPQATAAAAGGGGSGSGGGGGGVPAAGPGEPDLTAPSTMPSSSTVVAPTGFKGTLKHYQLKGMQWLVNLYDQGLNGILADEMGLGKTVQALSFLGYLAQERGIWGPFLVITPASTLHNWDNELHTFCPFFKVLPYWGPANDRKALRRNFAPRRLYGRNAPFHVAVTSYQIAVQDEAVLKKVKWQYMVLDEAQAIKSSGSQRWRALLSFGCRNRLLLSGTPIQNNLGELWALLHFIMPQLFDSLNSFNDWFSKDVEGAATSSSPASFVDPQQLARLHAVLTPFMLRRVKADVVAEMVPKTEVMVECKLSRRQRALYRALRNKVNLAELLRGVAGTSSSSSSSKLNSSLMNLVVQLRKVCSHPELFEAQPERLPYYFAAVNASPLLPGGQLGVLPRISPTGATPEISLALPKLVYREGCDGLSSYVLGGHVEGPRQKFLHHVLNPMAAANVAASLQLQQQQGLDPTAGTTIISSRTPLSTPSGLAAPLPPPGGLGAPSSRRSSSSSSSQAAEPLLGFQSGFSFARFLNLSPGEIHGLAAADPFQRWEVGVVGDTTGGGTRQQQLDLAALWDHYGWSNHGQRGQTTMFDQQPQVQQAPVGGLTQAAAAAQQQQEQEQQGRYHSSSSSSRSSSSSQQRARLRRAAHMLVIVDDLGLPVNSSSSHPRQLNTIASRSANSSSSSSNSSDGWWWGFSSSRGLTRPLLVDPAPSSSSSAVHVLPPLVLTSGQRVDLCTPLLRCCWGAVIPVLAPPPQLLCSDKGLELQMASLFTSAWCRQLLWGVDSCCRPPALPAGTPPLLHHLTTTRLAAAANRATISSWPATAAAAVAADDAAHAAAAATLAAAAVRNSKVAPEDVAAAAAVEARPPLCPAPPFAHPYHTTAAAAGAPGAPGAAGVATAGWPLLQPAEALLPPLTGALGTSCAPMQPYALAKALVDSGKLLALDGLLGQLKVEGHRVLIFCQMTQMMNLLEEYLSFRRHKYLRLDGSTTIAERRDMVAAFQSTPSIFVFLLSTRAGGLGINLTAADVVIFYESDWNPTMDLQAMDRCHRLGQTKPVTVYRLVTKGTIEARILQRAGQKRQVQALVMAEGGAAPAAAAAGEAVTAADDAGGDIEPEDVAALLREEASAWDDG